MKYSEEEDEEDKYNQNQLSRNELQRESYGEGVIGVNSGRLVPNQRDAQRQAMMNNEFRFKNQMIDPEYNLGIPQSRNSGEPIIKRQGSNLMQLNLESRQQSQPTASYPQGKRERRSKKNFDYPQYSRQMQEMDDFPGPSQSDMLERRSTSNNRVGMVEDRGTEKSNKDIYPFEMDDEYNNFSNKDSPQDNELMQFDRNQQDNEPSI